MRLNNTSNPLQRALSGLSSVEGAVRLAVAALRRAVASPPREVPKAGDFLTARLRPRAEVRARDRTGRDSLPSREALRAFPAFPSARWYLLG